MIRNFFIYIGLCMFCVACYDDKGNYDYTEINEVSIKGIEESYNVVTAIGTLDIEPEVEMTGESLDNKERFGIDWVLVTSSQKDTIGHEVNLHYPVDLAPGNYELYLKIRDKKTEVLWKQKTNISVSTAYSRGIMLIGEDHQGFADVQMIAMAGKDTVVYKNLLANSGLPALKGALDIIHTGNYGDKTKLWVMTKSGSYYLDRLTLKGSMDNNFMNMVLVDYGEELVPVDIAPRVKEIGGNTGTSSYRAMVCSNGYIFFNMIGWFGDGYGEPVNFVEGQESVYLKAKPYLFYCLKSWKAFIWYDAVNERFMEVHNPFPPCSRPLEDNEDNTFPWNQKESGRTLIYGENTYNTDGGSSEGNSFAIMQKGQEAYIYKFYATTVGEKRGCYTVAAEATGFLNADFYAFSSTRSVVFYVANNQLYAYDYNPGNEKLYPISLGTDDEITMLKFDISMEPGKDALYIATNNSTNGGTLQKYYVGKNPDKVELIPEKSCKWTGLTKVVNMCWRAAQ